MAQIVPRQMSRYSTLGFSDLLSEQSNLVKLFEIRLDECYAELEILSLGSLSSCGEDGLYKIFEHILVLDDYLPVDNKFALIDYVQQLYCWATSLEAKYKGLNVSRADFGLVSWLDDDDF